MILVETLNLDWGWLGTSHSRGYDINGGLSSKYGEVLVIEFNIGF